MVTYSLTNSLKAIDLCSYLFSYLFIHYLIFRESHIIVCIGISTPSQKHPLFLAKPPLNLQTAQAFLGNPPYILAFILNAP